MDVVAARTATDADNSSGDATHSDTQPAALPPQFWDERWRLYNRMRHERDRSNKRARAAALRAAEESQLAALTPQQRAAYEEEATRLRIEAGLAQKELVKRALAGEGLRVVIDCSFHQEPISTSSTAMDSENTPRLSASSSTACSDQEDVRLGETSAPSISEFAEPRDPPGACRGRWGRGVRQQDLTQEVRSLAKQVEIAMAMNRRSSRPVCLCVTSFTGGLAAFADHMGAAGWPIQRHARPTLDVFKREQVVVLSPDAEEPLLHLDPSRVYVVGGVVDRSVRKGLTAGFAQRHGLPAVRLPIREHAAQLGLHGPSASSRPVLNVSDAVVALVECQRTGDWVCALRAAIPARKLRGGAAGEAAAPRRRGGDRRLGGGGDCSGRCEHSSSDGCDGDSKSGSDSSTGGSPAALRGGSNSTSGSGASTAQQ